MTETRFDSPLCEGCIDKGKIGHTYKVTGKPLFRCSDCKKIYNRAEFEEVQMKWASEPMAYLKWRSDAKRRELVYDVKNSRVIRLKENNVGA